MDTANSPRIARSAQSVAALRIRTVGSLGCQKFLPFAVVAVSQREVPLEVAGPGVVAAPPLELLLTRGQ